MVWSPDYRLPLALALAALPSRNLVRKELIREISAIRF
jgi:hypothetical protein